MIKKNQKLWVELSLENPFKHDYEINELAGIANSTLCRWKQNQEFLDYYDEKLRQHWKNAGRKAQKQLEELAYQGDRQALIYILDHNGFNLPQQVDLNTNVIKVELDNDDIENQLKNI